MPKITKTTEGYTTTYFYDGVKKYAHYKDSTGFEYWSEYDKNGNEIHFKTSEGFESWSEYGKNGNQIHYKTSIGTDWFSPDHPNNPDNKEIYEEDIKPFTFNNS